MKTHNWLRNLVLLTILTNGAFALSAEEVSPVATPATEETTTADSSPTGSSFFSPKTEDDVTQMAHVSDTDLSEPATGND